MAAERRTSTRGRPPGYDRILLTPTCDTWHRDTLVDPIRPENNIGPNHIRHYTESCFKRILEYKNVDRIIPTLEQVKTWINEYVNEFITEPAQKELILRDYYNDVLIERMFQELFGERNVLPERQEIILQTPLQTRPKTLVKTSKKETPTHELIHPKFAKIEDILKTKKPIDSYVKIRIKSYKPIPLPIEETYHLIARSWDKLPPIQRKKNRVEYLLFMLLLSNFIKSIFIIEQTKSLLTERQLGIIDTHLNVWQSNFPEAASYVLQQGKDYMSIFIVMVNEYIQYRKINGIDENNKYRPLTTDEIINFLKRLKEKIVILLGLEHLFDKNEPRTQMIKILNELMTYRETYQYMWLFITEPVTYTISHFGLKQSDREGYCEDLLANANGFYKQIVDKVKDNCSLLITSQCDELKTFRKVIYDTLKNIDYKKYSPDVAWQNPNLDLYVQFHGVNREVAVIQFFKLWFLNYHQKDIEGVYDTLFWLKYIDVMYHGEEGFFVGVQKDLFQTCMDQLKPDKMNVFIPTEPEGNRYQFNRDFTFPQKYIDELSGLVFLDKDTNQPTKQTKALFMEFLGGLFSCALLMGIETPVKLSYFTLGYLYSNELFDKDYGLYFLMDIPSKAKPLYQLLKEDPYMIEYVGLEFNDQFPLLNLDESKKPHIQEKIQSRNIVTKNNVIDYINKTGEYILKTININDPPIIDLAMRKSYKTKREYYMTLLKSFKKGFFINVRGMFPVSTLTINMLDNLLNRGGINIDNLNQLISNNKVVAMYSEDNGTPERQIELRQQQKIFNWFINLLNNPDADIPYEKYIKNANKLSKEEKHNLYYNDFLPKLMYFWTSSRSVNIDEVHQVNFKLNDPRDQQSLNNQINAFNDQIKAHTCFRYIDIPTYNIGLPEFSENTPEDKRNWRTVVSSMDSKKLNEFIENHIQSNWKGWENILIDKLMLGIYETAGFGMAGGKKAAVKYINNNQVQQCIKHVQKKCSIEKDFNTAFVCGFIYTVKCRKILSKEHQNKLIEYAKKNAIDFKKSTPSQIKKWVTKMIKESI